MVYAISPDRFRATRSTAIEHVAEPPKLQVHGAHQHGTQCEEVRVDPKCHHLLF